jgi:hypothetical protein
VADLSSTISAHPVAAVGVAVGVGLLGLKFFTGSGGVTFPTNSGKSTTVGTDPGKGYVSNETLLAALRDQRQAILDEVAKQFTYWGAPGGASTGTLPPPGPVEPPPGWPPPGTIDPPGAGGGVDYFGPLGSGARYRSGVVARGLSDMGVY